MPSATAPSPGVVIPRGLVVGEDPEEDAKWFHVTPGGVTLITQDMLNRKSPYVITTDQLAMVAVGALAGALVVDMLGGGGLATLTGAAIGGVAGHWFYTQPDPSAGLLPTVQGG